MIFQRAPLVDSSFQRRRSGMTWGEILVVLTIVVTLIALMMPAVRSAREPARRTLCQNNLRNIGLALHSYHEKYQEFPRLTPSTNTASRFTAGGL